MYLKEELNEKWKKILDHESLSTIKDPYRRAVTAIALDNQQQWIAEDHRMSGRSYVSEAAPLNSTGGHIDNYDPIMISLVRRALPNLMAYDVCGVQPMTAPTGLIFALKSRYGDNTDPSLATEALFNEADTFFTSTNRAQNTAGVGTHTGTDPVANLVNATVYTTANGMATARAEALGDSGANLFPEMSFTIDKVQVGVRSRALMASYSTELAQDLKAVHGLDVETELVNILSSEILAEINREVIRTIYRSATIGAQYGTTTAGVFDLDTDANGRWSVERFKGLIMFLERECNALAKATRRGKGNIMIVSSDVASALAMTGVLEYNPQLNANLTVDDTGNTFVGTLHGRVKVYIDPYYGGSINGNELCVVGYKGTSQYDAGLFYCPYVPLQMGRATHQDAFQPRIGFKTRYGMVTNPFATLAGDGVVGDRSNANHVNKYYRILKVQNIM